MTYRAATLNDWPRISAFVDGTEYFEELDLDKLGGHWIIAVDRDEDIVGTIWFFAEKPHLFIDFWAADGPRTAARLGLLLRQFMEKQGIQYAHGMISCQNPKALRLATEGLGCLAAGPYYRVHKDINYGKSKDNADADDHDSGR